MKGISVVALAACLLLLLASPVLAGGLTVSGAKIDDVVRLASERSYIMGVQNASDAPMDIGVEVKGYGTTGESAFVALEPADDRLPFTARGMLSVSPDNFRLEPGSSQMLTISATIPSVGIGGGRYAIVLIHTIPPKGSQVATISAVAARVLLTIEGSQADHTSEVTALNMTEGRPLGVLVTLANNGNQHYRPHVQAVLRSGKEVFATASLDDGWPMIPGFGRDLKLAFASGSTIPPGQYEIDVDVTDDVGTPVAHRSFTVDIKAPYVPPPTTARPAAAAAPSNTIVVSSPIPAEMTSQSGKTKLGLVVCGIGGVMLLAFGVYALGVKRGRAGSRH